MLKRYLARFFWEYLEAVEMGAQSLFGVSRNLVGISSFIDKNTDFKHIQISKQGTNYL